MLKYDVKKSNFPEQLGNQLKGLLFRHTIGSEYCSVVRKSPRVKK